MQHYQRGQILCIGKQEHDFADLRKEALTKLARTCVAQGETILVCGSSKSAVQLAPEGIHAVACT